MPQPIEVALLPALNVGTGCAVAPLSMDIIVGETG